jgi:ABC-type sugar transport system permease subunit
MTVISPAGTETTVLAPAQPAPTRFQRWQHWRRSRSGREALTFYLFVSPWLLGFVFLTLFPFVMSFVASFTNYDAMSPLALVDFIGLRNYLRAFTDPDAERSFFNTLYFGVWMVPIGTLLAFSLALILNRDFRGKGTFRTIYFLPTVFPVVASATIWILVAQKNSGLLNNVLSLASGRIVAFSWLTEYPHIVLSAFILWTTVGGGMVVFLAGLQGISSELLDAARIDGATELELIWHVICPLMTPQIYFQVTMGIIGTLQIFLQPILMSPGVATMFGGMASVPLRPIYMFLNHVMVQSLVYQRFGYGMTLLWLLTIFVVVINFLLAKSSRFWVHSEAD